MTDSIRSSPPTLTLYTRPVTTGVARPVALAAAAALPAAREHPRPVLQLLSNTASGDTFTPSPAAAPALRAYLTGLTANRTALTTLGAVDSLLAAHYGTARSASE